MFYPLSYLACILYAYAYIKEEIFYLFKTILSGNQQFGISWQTLSLEIFIARKPPMFHSIYLDF